MQLNINILMDGKTLKTLITPLDESLANTARKT